MKEPSIKMIRLTPTVKARLDTFKGSDTVSVCVDRMITFFEITGFNPRYASKNPTALVEKRMEDMIKIIKAQEHEIFRPILQKLSSLDTAPQESEDYVQMMNELHALKAENARLRQQISEAGEPDGIEECREKLRRLAALVKYQLDPDKLQKVKFSDDVRIPMNQLRLLFKKIDEDYVL